MIFPISRYLVYRWGSAQRRFFDSGKGTGIGRRSRMLLLNDHHPVTNVRTGNGVIPDFSNFSAQLGNGAFGGLDLLVGVHRLHGQELAAYLHQGQGQLTQYVQLGNGPGGGDVEFLPMLPGKFFGPGMHA